MDRKECKRQRIDDVSEKFHDAELAFEYEMGVEYQEKLMQRQKQMKEKKERTPYQK